MSGGCGGSGGGGSGECWGGSAALRDALPGDVGELKSLVAGWLAAEEALTRAATRLPSLSRAGLAGKTRLRAGKGSHARRALSCLVRSCRRRQLRAEGHTRSPLAQPAHLTALS